MSAKMNVKLTKEATLVLHRQVNSNMPMSNLATVLPGVTRY